jgi:hypothetical protein
MSHFTRIKTQMIEQEYITRALSDLGYQWEQGELTVKGFAGARAHVAIKVKLPGSSHEIGFRKSGEAFEIIADWWGVRGVSREKFRQQVSQRYAYHAARAKLENQGFVLVSEETQEEGRLHLVLRRTA